MSVEVTHLTPLFADEEPRDKARITTLLRYIAPDDEEWTHWCDFFVYVETGHRWSERVTWKHGCFFVELLDENLVQHQRWNVAIPDSVLWPLKKKRR